MDANGTVLNAKYAEKRATDYIRWYLNPQYIITPPFEEWEVELHGPPPLRDEI